MKYKNFLIFFHNKSFKFKIFFTAIIFISVIIVFVDAFSIFTLLPILSISVNKNLANSVMDYSNYVPDWVLSLQQGIDLKVFFLILIIILFLRNVFHLLNNFVIYRFARYIEIDTAKKSYFLILKKKYLELSSQTSSELIKDLRDSVGSYVLFIESVARIISDIIILLLFSSILFYLSFNETLFIFSYFILIFLIFSKTVTNISVRQGKKTNLSAEKINLTIINTFKNFAQIILRKLKNKYLNIYTLNVKEFTYSRLIISFLKSNTKQFLEIFVLILVVVIFLFLEKFYVKNTENLFALITIYIVAAYRMLPLVNNLAASIIKVRNLEYPFNIIHKNIKNFNKKYKNLKIENSNIKKINFSKNLILKNITFKYPRDKDHLFKNLNLEIKKNEMIGIIGPSGEGKSTLVKILLGLIEPISGIIKVDKKKIFQNQVERYQMLFGYLPQQNLFIPDTIKENIAFGKDNIDEKKVVEALIKTNCMEFVKKLKNNINYKLQEDGKNFSSGQLQRFALARILYFNNDIIILDEPTSALDKKAEKKFIQLVNKLKRQKTIIIVSHKESTLRNCDKIYKLKNKKMIRHKKLS